MKEEEREQVRREDGKRKERDKRKQVKEGKQTFNFIMLKKINIAWEF